MPMYASSRMLDGSGHGTQMNPFPGGAALNIINIALAAFRKLPGPFPVRPPSLRMDHPAQRGAIGGTMHIIIDIFRIVSLKT